jgi:hypothetical protein
MHLAIPILSNHVAWMASLSTQQYPIGPHHMLRVLLIFLLHSGSLSSNVECKTSKTMKNLDSKGSEFAVALQGRKEDLC